MVRRTKAYRSESNAAKKKEKSLDYESGGLTRFLTRFLGVFAKGGSCGIPRTHKTTCVGLVLSECLWRLFRHPTI